MPQLKNLLLTVCMFGVLRTARSEKASGRVLYREDFEDDGRSLAERGWTTDATPEQSVWEVSDGSLRVTCFFKPYQGGRIRRQVPYVSRGELTFDAQLACGGSAGYNHLSLQFFYGMLLSLKNYGGHHLQRYHDGKWRRVASNVPLRKWVRIRVRFDAAREIAEYYCGDVQYPTDIETGIVIRPKPGQDTIEMAIGNYGLCTGTLVHRVDNIELRETPQASSQEATGEAVDGKRVVVYRGISFQRLRVSEIVKRLGVAEPAVFTMQTGLGLRAENRLFLDRMPSVLSSERPRTILMADLPVGPNDAVPRFLLDRMCDDVRQGARLVILGGPFTLGKGCFQGTSLEDVLPVELGGPWEVVKAARPLPLRTADSSLSTLLDGQDPPVVFYYHQVKPRKDARVVAYAGDRPVMFERSCGRGRVVVFAGTPLGKSTEQHRGFWEWPRWPEFVVSASGLEGE